MTINKMSKEWKKIEKNMRKDFYNQQSTEAKEVYELCESLVKQGLYKWKNNKTECFPVKNINELVLNETKQMIQKQMKQVYNNLKIYYDKIEFKGYSKE